MQRSSRRFVRLAIQAIGNNRDRLAYYLAFAAFLTVLVTLLANIGALRSSPFLAALGFGLMSVLAATLLPLAKRMKANENSGLSTSTNHFNPLELSISDSGLEIGGQKFRIDELRKIVFNGSQERKTLNLTFEKTSGAFRDTMMYLCNNVQIEGTRKRFKSIEDAYDFLKTQYPMAVDESGLESERS